MERLTESDALRPAETLAERLRWLGVVDLIPDDRDGEMLEAIDYRGQPRAIVFEDLYGDSHL